MLRLLMSGSLRRCRRNDLSRSGESVGGKSIPLFIAVVLTRSDIPNLSDIFGSLHDVLGYCDVATISQ